ncbi:hypothetical protein [Pseudomonas sp. KU43P]|uniref:hypothetical protein n=1 Tax=Pseudomonas sp. KU43P TaxID=2487887 RepID=UPI0012A9A98D|nr:hypothetical protein [Pseudomonas sp. KU43P]BBH46040.1 hypothetical protein KU43P_25170 [Pseudomonas sp. KU43P]
MAEKGRPWLIVKEILKQTDDYCLIPMEDDRFAISQIIWLGTDSEEQKFKELFAFCEVSIDHEKNVPEKVSYLNFKDHRGDFKAIFTAVDNIKSEKWSILHEGFVVDASLSDLEFNMAGALYRRGQPVRVLAIEEYKDYLLMGSRIMPWWKDSCNNIDDFR